MANDLYTSVGFPGCGAIEQLHDRSIVIPPVLRPSAHPPRPSTVVTVYQRYSSLRLGREQEMEVVLCKPAHNFLGVPYCPASVVNLDPLNQTEVQPLSLELNTPPGFTVLYREGRKYRPRSQATPLEIGARKVFVLRLRAPSHVPLGLHVLEGRAKFLQGDQGPGGVWSGNGVVQEIAFKVPVMIVKHDARVIEAEDWPERHGGCMLAHSAHDAFTLIQASALQWLLNNAGF